MRSRPGRDPAHQVGLSLRADGQRAGGGPSQRHSLREAWLRFSCPTMPKRGNVVGTTGPASHRRALLP